MGAFTRTIVGDTMTFNVRNVVSSTLVRRNSVLDLVPALWGNWSFRSVVNFQLE